MMYLEDLVMRRTDKPRLHILEIPLHFILGIAII